MSSLTTVIGSSQYLLFSIPLLLFALLVVIRTLPPRWRINSKFSVDFSGKNRNGKPKESGEGYKDVFPPSQRETLASISSQFSMGLHSIYQTKLLKLEDDYRKAPDNKLVFSGFSVGDIKKLGDFPDYATLSGVPLPAPLPDFNIDTAMPRPYRPFRWAYHQTMCK